LGGEGEVVPSGECLGGLLALVEVAADAPVPGVLRAIDEPVIEQGEEQQL